jgi:two-component system, OmpR family, sensor kinase
VNSLRAHLLAAFAYVLVLVLVALAIPFALSVSSRVEAEVEGQAAGQAHLIAATVAGLLDEPAALRRNVARLAGDVDGRVVVVDSNGRLLADSAGDALVGTSYGDRPEVAAALGAGTVEQGRRRSETLDEELLYTAVPIVDEGVRVGAVRVTRSVAPIESRIRRDRLAVAGIAAAALALGLALAWLVASSLARPPRQPAETARRLGGGDLDARAELDGPVEQRDVAAAFNDMADRLGRVLQAQREFVANASHQLRTPLTGLRLRLEAASLKAADPAVARDLEAAEREAERLAALLAALLTLAREGGEAAAPQPVSLADAAERARERWGAEAEREGLELRLAAGGDVYAGASTEDVAIVLDNLLENALRYSPPGGDATIAWVERDGRAVLAVLDRGPGLGEDEAERVWERFARGSAARSGVAGTGLGLTIVRTLARRWGGDAHAFAREGGGARFEVTLPLVSAPLGSPRIEEPVA